MVAGGRRRQPDPVSGHIERRLDRKELAHPLAAAGTGGRATCGVSCMSVSIAVPTGMLLPGSLRLLARAGVMRLGAAELGRRLLGERSGVPVILVRPADLPASPAHAPPAPPPLRQHF